MDMYGFTDYLESRYWSTGPYSPPSRLEESFAQSMAAVRKKASFQADPDGARPIRPVSDRKNHRKNRRRSNRRKIGKEPPKILDMKADRV